MGWWSQRRVRSRLFSEVGRIGEGSEDEARSHVTMGFSGDEVFFADSEMIHVFGSGSFVNEDGDDPTVLAQCADRLFWHGAVEEAFALLAAVEDGSGPRVFLRHVCPRLPAAALWSELERVGVTGPGSVDDWNFDDPYSVISDEELQRLVQDEGYAVEPLGTLTDEEHQRLIDEDESDADIGDGGWNRVIHDTLFGDEDVLVESNKGLAWSGTLDDAVERVRSLPDSAGLEALWQAFADA